MVKTLCKEKLTDIKQAKNLMQMIVLNKAFDSSK